MTNKLELTIKNNKIQVSDGYHTFDELYEHRQVLFIALCNKLYNIEFILNKYPSVWKSKLHPDWTMFEDMFIMGIWTESGKIITYHLDDIYRDLCRVKELDRAPERDWHTSDDVLKRLLEL